MSETDDSQEYEVGDMLTEEQVRALLEKVIRDDYASNATLFAAAHGMVKSRVSEARKKRWNGGPSPQILASLGLVTATRYMVAKRVVKPK